MLHLFVQGIVKEGAASPGAVRERLKPMAEASTPSRQHCEDLDGALVRNRSLELT